MLNKQDIFITPADRHLVNKMSPLKYQNQLSGGTATHIHTPGGQTTVVNQYYGHDSHFFRDLWLINALDRPYYRRPYYHYYDFARPPHFYSDSSGNTPKSGSSAKNAKKNGKDRTGLEILAIIAAAAAATYAGYKSFAYSFEKIQHALGNLRTPRKIFKSITRLGGAISGGYLGGHFGIMGAKWLLDTAALSVGVEIFSALSIGAVGVSIGIATIKLLNRFNPFLGNDKYHLRYGTIKQLETNPHFSLSEGQALMINAYLLGKIECAKGLANHPDIILRDKRLLNLFTTLRKEGLKRGNPHALLSLKEYLETEEKQMADLLEHRLAVRLPEGISMQTVKDTHLHLQFMLGKLHPVAYKEALNQAPEHREAHFFKQPGSATNAGFFHAFPRHTNQTPPLYSATTPEGSPAEQAAKPGSYRQI